MTNYIGDVRLGDTLDVKFCTVISTGAPTTLAGTPVVSAYPGNSTTQLTAGITLTVDFDGVTGLHNVRVVASSGNGYATATNYYLVITTGTVGGTSVVGYVIGSFSIEARSAVMPTTAARTLDVSAGGEAGLDWANVGSPTTTLALTGTTVGTATAVTTVNGLAANVITATSINADAITAAKIADGAIDRATFAADTGLQPIRSSTAQAGAAGTITLDASASAVDNFYNDCMIILTGGTGVGQARFIVSYVGATKVATIAPNWATNPDNTSTFAVLRDTRKDLGYIAGAVVSTSVAQLGVNAVNLGGTAQTGRDIGASVLLSAGTGTGQLDFTSGVVKANLVQILATALTETAGLLAGGFKKFFNVATPTGTLNSIPDAVAGAAGGLFIAGTNAATTVTTALTTTFTGNLTGSVGSVTGAVGSVTGAVGSVTGNVGGNVTGSVGSVASGGITAASIADGAIDRATFAADTGLQTVRSNTAQAGAAGTITLDASASATNDFYNDAIVYLTGGTGAGQVRLISGYVGSTKVATITPNWATNPDNTSTFAVIPRNRVALGTWLSSVPSALISGRVDSNTQAMANDVITAAVIADNAIDAGAIAANAITAAKIATDAIGAAQIAADAIGASELAADAVVEIQSGLSTLTQANIRTAVGLASANLDTQLTTIDDFLDTEVASIIATLGSAGAGLTAVPWNAAWDAEVQSEVDDALVARFLDKLVIVSGTADSGSTSTMVDAARTEADNDYWKGRLILFTSGNISGQCAIITDFVAATDTFTFAPPFTQAVATQNYVILPGLSVWDDTLAEHLISGSTGSALNAAGAAGDPWSTALPGAYGAGTGGFIVGTNLNGTVTSRASQTSLDTLDDFVDTEVAAIKAKTDQLTFTTANKIDATIQIAGDFAQGAADKVWATAARTLTAFGFSVTVGTNSDKTGYTLSSAGIQAIWDALTAALTTVGSVGKLLVDNINATISSRASQTSLDTLDDFVDTEVSAIKAVTDLLPNGGALTTIQADLDNIQTRIPVALVSGRIDSSVGAMATDTLTAAALAADAIAEIQAGLSTLTAAQIWDLSNGVETGLTPRQAMRLLSAALAGKLSGAATATVTIRNAVADSANRITATVDADGNRTAISYDVS